MSIVFLKGEFIPATQATVSVFDRGFLFSDSIYEYIPLYEAHPFELKRHITRLHDSLIAIGIEPPHTLEKWAFLINSLIEKNNIVDNTQYIYIQVSRGSNGTRHHHISGNLQPTVLIACIENPANHRPPIEKGIRAITLPDKRWHACHIKATTLLPNILSINEAHHQKVDEAILIDDQGHANEANSANIFIVVNNQIITPPDEANILSGVTRAITVELAHEKKLSLIKKYIPVEQLRKADEIWLTSSSREITPVIELDASSVGTGKPGPVWKKMFDYFQEYKSRALIECGVS